MLFIRFTETEPTKTEISYNSFNNTKLKGICCFQLDEKESIYLQARNIADKFSNYVENSNGVAFVFEGEFIENNFNNEGVIAKFDNTIEKLQLVKSQLGYKVL